jgi:hypothetical protein
MLNRVKRNLLRRPKHKRLTSYTSKPYRSLLLCTEDYYDPQQQFLASPDVAWANTDVRDKMLGFMAELGFLVWGIKSVA